MKAARTVSSVAVVGIGASAGGLEAFTRFLNALRPRPGVAFVLVQHLDPTHASQLAQLLAKATSMPVAAIHDRHPWMPNNAIVYDRVDGIMPLDGIATALATLANGGLVEDLAEIDAESHAP